jgi:hypothetical protein
MADKRAQRRRQLARHPKLLAAILGEPTLAAKTLLLSLDGQPFKPAWGRAVMVAARHLGTALASVHGHHSVASREAKWWFAGLMAFMQHAVERSPHLIHTRETNQPWPGWHADLAALAEQHPEWASAINEDGAYLARLEAAIEHDNRMERTVREAIAECRSILSECDGSPATSALTARLRDLIDDLQGQLRTYAPPMVLPNLATMPIQGSA